MVGTLSKGAESLVLHVSESRHCIARLHIIAMQTVQIFLWPYFMSSYLFFTNAKVRTTLAFQDWLGTSFDGICGALQCTCIIFFCATQRENLWDTDLRPKLAPFQVDFLTPFGSIWAVCQVYAFWLLLSKVRVVSSWQQAEDREDQKTQSDQQTMRNELLLHGCFQDPSKKTAQVASSRAQGNQKDVLR